MVRALLLACLLLLPGLPATAAVTRKPPQPFELDRTALALGEPLQLRLTRALASREPPLEALDLAPLQRDFELLERTLGRDAAQETLTLTLYPRRAGRFELPTLGRAGRAPRVTVTDGSEAVSRVQWKLSLEPPEPMLRQSVTFTLEACDDGSLLWKRPTLQAGEGLLLRALNETEIVTSRDGQRCTAHRWHWALLPTATGELTLPLPVLEAGKFGQRLRFHLPPLSLRAAPLPAWLPAEAAVGEPEFSAEPLPAQASIGQPLAWRLQVRGGWSVPALQQLLAQQLREAPAPLGLATYAPQIEPLPAADDPLPRYRVTLYLVPSARGTFALPTLQLPWYDPESGLLRQAQLDAATLEVSDPLRARWLQWSAAAAALLLVAAGLAALWRWQGWRWQRRVALRRVLRAADGEALHRAVLAFSLQRGQAPAATLRSWQERMVQQCRKVAVVELEELVGLLEQQRYGAAAAQELAALRAQANTRLRHARPRRPGRPPA